MAQKKVSAKTKQKKVKSSGKRILLLLLVLVLLFVITMVFTPTEDEFLASQQSTLTAGGRIEGLEFPQPRSGDMLITHTGFTLAYNETHEQPDWVAYELTREEVYGVYDRADNFRADSTVPTGSASLADYRNSGYDRGHLIPAADLKWSAEAMNDSFYMSNMSPQDPQFNRGIWSKLESVIRNFAVTNESIYVVTGPVLTDGPYETIGTNQVSVPKRYYKVVLDYTDPDIKAIGFVLPNEGSNKPLEEFAVSVREVETLTGLNFFYLLPDDIEHTLETTFDVSLWDFSEFQASAAEREAMQGDGSISSTQAVPKQQGSSIQNSILTVLVMIKTEIMSIIDTILT